LGRQNLRLETGCLVERIETTDWRATGVRWRQDGVTRSARCRGEVILSAGSIGSAQLLLLSGIGPGLDLLDLGIPVELDRPGVGNNLQDHLQLRMIYKVSGVKTLNETYHSLFGRAGMGLDYLLRRRGPLTMAPSQLGIFTRSDPARERANIQFHVQPLSLDKFGDPLHTYPAFTTSVCNLQPASRGSVKLRSADPADKPKIAPRYLSAEEDRRVAADSLRVARGIVAQPALQKFHPVETLPGEQIRSDDEAGLAKAAGDIGTTIFHPVGTAKMGLTSDPNTVVDARLRVLGIERLRVIDASVMPTITSGNTNSPTMMIAEKGALMVLADQRR
jgi:choline dehydrogenase-like flavoprotein